MTTSSNQRDPRQGRWWIVNFEPKDQPSMLIAVKGDWTNRTKYIRSSNRVVHSFLGILTNQCDSLMVSQLKLSHSKRVGNLFAVMHKWKNHLFESGKRAD